jgi:hypothetical protein
VLALPKEKLTLSVDKEVVDKAKNLGINISEITEKILTGYTSAQKPSGSIFDAYEDLFNSIKFLLKEFDCRVKVAQTLIEDEDSCFVEQEYFLTQYGTFFVHVLIGPPQESHFISDIKKIDPRDFLTPDKILSNLLKELVQAQEKREEKMEELLMAKRIIDAMSESLLKKSTQPKEKS